MTTYLWRIVERLFSKAIGADDIVSLDVLFLLHINVVQKAVPGLVGKTVFGGVGQTVVVDMLNQPLGEKLVFALCKIVFCFLTAAPAKNLPDIGKFL